MSYNKNSIKLPQSEENTFYIVSVLIRQAFPERKDLVSPGKLVRNNSGEVIGCENFIVNELSTI